MTKQKAEFKEGKGKYKCTKCGDSRNKIYPDGHKQYCVRCKFNLVNK